MFHKIIFRVILCVLLLTIASCSAPETITSRGTAEVSGAETTKAESEKVGSDASEVIIRLGDKKLTVQQVKWMQPNAAGPQIAMLADWWLENELLYAEAKRRGITKERKAKFLAEVMRRRGFAQELRTQVWDAVKISEESILAYYEKNKKTDRNLQRPGRLSFSHIRTKTLEEAQAVLERIKAGEDINELAKELSIDDDAKKGGVVKKRMYKTIRRKFGNEFFEALEAAKEGELIGPIKAKKDGYEVARQERKIEPEPLPFEKVKDSIKTQLQRTEKDKTLKSLLDSLKKEADDKIVRSPLIIQTRTSGIEKSKEGKKEESSEGKQK